MTTKLKTYPHYKSSGIDWLREIPNHWELTKGKWSCSFIYGFPADSRLFIKENIGLPLIRIRDINSEDTEVYYTGNDYPQDSLIAQGDVLIGMDGEFNIAKWRGPKAILNQRICKYDETNSELNKNYIFFLMPLILSDINMTKYATTVKHLSSGDLSDMILPIPPIEEQEAIAGYLDEMTGKIDALMSEKRAQVEDLRKYRNSLITETVTRGLNPNVPIKHTNSEWFPNIPTNWSIEKFKYQATVKANLVHPTDYTQLPQISPDSIEKNTGRLLGYKSVEEAGIISDNHLFYKGQIIYSKIRPNLNKVIIAPFDGLCSADMYPIETLNNVRYFQYLMLSNPFVSQVSVVIQDRVKMPKINQVELGEILILVPPVAEQQQIADYLDEKTSKIDALIKELEAQLSDLATYKQAVITEAVTGKVDVRDWTPKN